MYDDLMPVSMEMPRDDISREKKGLLIALEGIDGSGKTTLSNLCVEQLRKLGYKAVEFRVSTPYTAYWQSVMEAKRDMNKTDNPMPGDIDQSLFAFEFLTYIRCMLPKLLEENDYIFCDRYVLGKMVLADMETDMQNSWTKEMLKEMLSNGTIPNPDLNIYLYITPESARERILTRGKKLEAKEELPMLRKAYHIFNEYEKDYEMERIDSEQDIKVIVDTIVNETLNIQEHSIEA